MSLALRPFSLPYSPECVEEASLLKKWVSTRSAVQESPKTRPKRYRNGVFGPRAGAEESAKEFFNRLRRSRKFVSRITLCTTCLALATLLQRPPW